jgi:hypothetical protein
MKAQAKREKWTLDADGDWHCRGCATFKPREASHAA